MLFWLNFSCGLLIIFHTMKNYMLSTLPAVYERSVLFFSVIKQVHFLHVSLLFYLTYTKLRPLNPYIVLIAVQVADSLVYVYSHQCDVVCPCSRSNSSATKCHQCPPLSLSLSSLLSPSLSLPLKLLFSTPALCAACSGGQRCSLKAITYLTFEANGKNTGHSEK